MNAKSFSSHSRRICGVTALCQAPASAEMSSKVFGFFLVGGVRATQYEYPVPMSSSGNLPTHTSCVSGSWLKPGSRVDV